MAKGGQLYNNSTTIAHLLFEKEEQSLLRREMELVDKNASLGGSPDGFRHMGRIYSHLMGRARAMGQYKPIVLPLVNEISALGTERKILEADQERITQALVLVLRGTSTWQDIRDALPNSLKDLIPEIKDRDRTRPVAYTLEQNSRSYNQFMKLSDKIDYYVAMRLLH